MKQKKATPFEKEVKRLQSIGKSPDVIAIRLGVKISKVLPLLNPTNTPA